MSGAVALAMLTTLAVAGGAGANAAPPPTESVTSTVVAPYSVDDGVGREKINFNRDWKFIRQDATGASATSFDDSAWVGVGLPHDFDAPYDVGGTSSGGQNFYVGVGWYRKSFEVATGWSAKRIELEFEAVFQIADVYVNGTHIGTHRGGYTGFVYDITSALHAGTNEIAVRVDNTWQQDLAPRAGDHQFTGGIYRDVYLNVTEGVHVTWYGDTVTTPSLTNPEFDTSNPAYYVNIDPSQYPSDTDLAANLAAKRSNVRVQTEVTNSLTTAADVQVEQKVKDSDGIVVATFSSAPRTLAAGETYTFDTSSGATDDIAAMIKNLSLWSPDTPALYSVATSVISDGTVDGSVTAGTRVDTYDATFGFRSAQWKNDGLYLNGVKTELNGANVHQDHGGWANAVTDSGFSRDVSLIKQAGMNFIRGSHYPHDPSFADATDAQGVMFWSESDFWGMGGQAGKNDDATGQPSDWLRDAYPQRAADQAAFDQSALDALTAMIRVNRNHPSIINWSMGNEVFFTASGTQAKAKALVNSMRNLAHKLDPTRKAAMGGVQREGYDSLAVADIAGYNGDGGTFTNLTMPNLVSEYGSYTSDRPAAYAPHYGDIASGSDGYVLKPNSAGLAVWAGFDHGTVGGAGLARMGMIDYYRVPKNQWYWYRANKSRWSTQTPVARESSTSGTATKMALSASTTTITDDGKKDTQILATLQNASSAWVSDTRPVTLTVTSGPGVFPGGKSYSFTPGLNTFDGKAAIEFRSYYAGTTTITATSAGLPDATIIITTEDTVGAASEQEPEHFADSTMWGAQAATVSEPVVYGSSNKALSRPVTVSSETTGHGKSKATDGDPTTSWFAGAAGAGQSLSVFLEFAQNIYKTRLDFDGPALPYTLEVQDADGDWTTVASYTAATVGTRPLEDSIDGLYAESIRVTFPDLTSSQTASIAELSVYGNDASLSPQYKADGVYMSDVVDYANNVTSGSGLKGKNTSASGGILKVGGRTYAKGLGLQAPSSVTYDLDGHYSRIAGVAGIDNEVTGGDAVFEIYSDDTLIYTKHITGNDTDAFDVSVSGADQLRLVTTTNGSATNDRTDWADVRLFGAIRSITGTDDLTASFAGLTDQLQAATPYRGTVYLKNTGDESRDLDAGIAVYHDGQLVGIEVEPITLAADASGSVDLSVDLPEDITGYSAQVGVWDAGTLQRLSQFVTVSADPAALTGVLPVLGTSWTTKVDGEAASLVKTGTWANWPSASAYAGTETFTLVAASTIAYTFTGDFVRVATKFDGSQVGASVSIDGTSFGSFSTLTSAGDSYKVAWTSPQLTGGPTATHTITLTSSGKFGLDYFESGTAIVAEPVDPAGVGSILGALKSVIDLVRTDAAADLDPSDVHAIATAFTTTYGVYTDPAATVADYNAAANSLQGIVTAAVPTTTSIEVTTPPAKVTYRVGESLDTAGLVVSAVRSDGTKLTLTSDQYTLAGFNSSQPGATDVTVTLVSDPSKTVTFQVTVQAIVVTVSSIEVTAPPAKVAYRVGESLHTAGLVVSAVRSDGTKLTLTSDQYTLAGFDSARPGTVTVTVALVSDPTKKTTFKVTVLAPDLTVRSISVAKKPSKTTYVVGQKLATRGLSLTAVMSDGSKRALGASEYTVTGFSSKKAGKVTVTVTLRANTAKKATFAVKIVKNTVVKIKITKRPKKTTYKVGQKFSTKGLVVTAILRDGSKKKLKKSKYVVSKVSTGKIGKKIATVKVKGHKSVKATFTVKVKRR